MRAACSCIMAQLASLIATTNSKGGRLAPRWSGRAQAGFTTRRAADGLGRCDSLLRHFRSLAGCHAQVSARQRQCCFAESCRRLALAAGCLEQLQY